MIMTIDNFDPIKNLKKWAEEIELCEELGHPFQQITVTSYQPGRDVLVKCSGCGGFYERPANSEERQSYTDAMKLEFTI